MDAQPWPAQEVDGGCAVDLALCIMAGGIVLVAVLLVIKCPSDKIVDLADAFARWISGAPKPPGLGPPAFQVQIMPQPEAGKIEPGPGEIEPPAA
jgi:hypothetical protein